MMLNNNSLLKGKTALISGACSGIGQKLCNDLAIAGVNLILISASKIKLEKLVKSIELLHENIVINTLIVDFLDDDLENKFKQFLVDFDKIDFCVNLSGKFIQREIENTSISDIRSLLEINYIGTFILLKNVVPIMKRAGKGDIINFASIGGKLGLKHKSAYCASKHAMVGFSKSLAKELNPFGIRVNCLYPYLVDSLNEIAWHKGEKANEDYILSTADVSKVILSLLHLPRRISFDDISLRPLKY